MILAGAFLAAAFSGQSPPPLRLPPTPMKDVGGARADITRCLAVQAGRLERLEENLEVVARLAIVECEPLAVTYIHASGGMTPTEFARKSSEARQSSQSEATQPRLGLSANAMPIAIEITQALTREATRDAIAAREARLSAHKN